MRPDREDGYADPRLDRRFEAVVLWRAAPSVPVSVVGALGALGAAGVAVGVLAPSPVDDLAGALMPSLDGATLLVADTRGIVIATADRTGVAGIRRLGRGLDLGTLDAAGREFARRLTERGLCAEVLPRPVDSPRVTVELRTDRGHRLNPSTLKSSLLGFGITGMPQIVSLATESARATGLDEPRVLVDGGTVDIAAIDAGDLAMDALMELWRHGVDPHDALLVIDGLAGVPHRPAPVVEPDIRATTVVLLNSGQAGPIDGAVALPGGRARLRRLLADQLRRRRGRCLPGMRVRPGWALEVDGFDRDDEAVCETLLTLADGRIGVGGSPLASHSSRHPWVVVSGVYEGAGAHSRLLTAPVTFRLGATAKQGPLTRVLDLRGGVLHEQGGEGRGRVESARFVSLVRPGTSVMRASHADAIRPGLPLLRPANDLVAAQGRAEGAMWMQVQASSGGVTAAARQDRARRVRRSDGDPGPRVFDRVAVYHADTAALPEPQGALEASKQAAAIGFDRLLAEHRRAWARRWEAADVVVEGDDELQLGIRFALFHLMAAAPDSGEAAVGARGLSGTGYGGHVFWDADTFVLPFLAATHPASARAMLEYRIRRLSAALHAAHALGRSGARFPWESALTGEDVTPTRARDRAGRTVAIRTGQLEEHIVAQVPWAACCYADWTGDSDFAAGPGRRLLVETARYWTSRIRVETDGSAHIYGVVGPDEYHEPVDDNAFTNVMARWNLRRAAEATAEDAGSATGIEASERRHWLDLADALYDGYDGDTGIYEQFAGFKALEPLVISEVAPRRPIAADLLLGPERTRSAQVIKQADVLLLHHLVPEEVEPGSLDPNLRYYEPRTAHGSSLSPAIHASVLARSRLFDSALDALRIAARLDLDDLTGTSTQGLHMATMGGLWQALAFGFMGLRPHGRRLHLDPVLAPSWSSLEMRVRFRGVRVRVRKERARLTVEAEAPLPLVVGDLAVELHDRPLELWRRGARWEEAS